MTEPAHLWTGMSPQSFTSDRVPDVQEALFPEPDPCGTALLDEHEDGASLDQKIGVYKTE
ncbi:hypothetical protein JHN59_07970 [Streptomyces sp. MBT49]|uniref:hypothetical protein n=1 Tax=Streptomyces sp. MBT49 TaxID=1488380 RepID=UPI00190B0CC0|nr:hypothetical protein [Streptomyces sp. MBT49]MBK3624786.1 hypothetical protein [Streptomyces sp. MBT49]